MSVAPSRSYRSTGQPGLSPHVRSQPGMVFAHKVPDEVNVEFATEECTVRTREGTVRAHAGDAILTGKRGDRWRVSRARFADKYRPVAPTVEGADGLYAALPIRVAAVQIAEPFEVMLSDGVSVLSGAPGDWLVDYGDGSLGVIAPAIFAASYRIGD
jgi:hypothetical protein